MVEGIIGFPDMLSMAQTIGIVGTMIFSFYILWICSHAHAMRQRKVLDDNEWAGWLQWMRNCFRKGTIKETWKRVEQDRWFNPAFQDFVNTEIAGGNLRT